MNRECLARMSAEELDAYGVVLGIDMRPAKTESEKAALIEDRRSHEAVVTALGCEFRVAKKRLYDKRASDLLGKPGMTDAEAEEAISLLLGERQMAQLVEAATDEDGTVDTAALGHAFARILTSEELKNS